MNPETFSATTQVAPLTLTDAIVQSMQDKKAEDIRVIDLKNIPHAIADYFIICSGNAKRQVEAIADAIVTASHQHVGERPWRQEGLAASEWVLLDYIDVIVHVFHAAKRDFYALDALWGDAPTLSISPGISVQ